MAGVPTKVRIGDLLVEAGEISNSHLEEALSQQKTVGKKLGRILIEMGAITEKRLLQVLSQQLNLPFVSLRQFPFNLELVNKLEESQARRHKAIVLADKSGVLQVGMADPLDLFAYDELCRSLRQSIDVAIVRESELLDTLDTVYRRTQEIETYAVELESEVTDGLFDLQGLQATLTGDEAPVVRLLQSIFEDAVQVRASDIHIEPDESVLRIRQRVDGILQEQVMKERRISAPLVLRLKLMAGLNISERRLPQDGRFSLIVRDRKLDVRMSTMPVEHGESCVLRILDQSAGLTALEDIGMNPKMLARFRKMVQLPYGLILVTGPTGSGKTTTLYGALNELNQPGQKIITVEDPVEYKISRINQVQVNPTIGLNFASILRAGLRQDPDIILVGEIRDVETAEISLRASMTGHLVLSTLHTNDSISSATRLIDMGVEPFLAASSIRAIVAQRLVRKLCSECALPEKLSQQETEWMSRYVDNHVIANGTPRRAVGCHHCNHTGFRGRIGIFEMLQMDEEITAALRKGNTAEFVDLARLQEDYKPLLVSALEHVVNGVTTVSEAIRVAQQFDTDVPELANISKEGALEQRKVETSSEDASLSLEAIQ